MLEIRIRVTPVHRVFLEEISRQSVEITTLTRSDLEKK